MKEVTPMKDQKVYLLAELTIQPEFLEEVKAILWISVDQRRRPAP
jgi:hypothetical protein